MWFPPLIYSLRVWETFFIVGAKYLIAWMTVNVKIGKSETENSKLESARSLGETIQKGRNGGTSTFFSAVFCTLKVPKTKLSFTFHLLFRVGALKLFWRSYSLHDPSIGDFKSSYECQALIRHIIGTIHGCISFAIHPHWAQSS